MSGSDRLGAHHGLVTGLSIHPHMNGRSKLALSSGVDWSTKLWFFQLPVLSKETGSDASTNKLVSDTKAPKLLYDFRGPYEQVSDVEWSPAHPSLFATCNGVGSVSLYDLTHSLEDPRLPSTQVSSSCLTKLRWSLDGRRIAVGDLDGRVSLLSVSPDIADSKEDSMANFDKIINKLY